ncbi:hypothetical protein N665_0029s0052 [Sinapis alba]|nr:hypothetical protein N665_0029s0052 [Sinapis alba]
MSSGKGLSPASFSAPPMTVQDADPLRFRVGEQDPKTREFAAFIGDQHRYFAAAAAAAAAANPHPHLEFHQNFYSEKPISGNPNDSGGSDDVDEEEEDEEEEEDDVDGNEGDGMNKDAGDDRVSAGGAVTAVEQDNVAYYSQQFKTMEAGFVSRHEESSLVAAENGCDVSGRRDTSSSSSLSNSIESLRTILSDPITGALMSDAMILPCGHTFGAGGIEQVKQMKACCTCSQPVSEDSITPNLTLRVAVQAFCREEKSQSNHSSKRKREGGFDQERRSFGGDSTYTSRSRNRTNHFPFAVADRVIIKGNKRTPPRFVGREAIVTTQCLNGWYVVKTLDNAESVKLQYRSLAKATEDPSAKATPSKMVSNWL